MAAYRTATKRNKLSTPARLLSNDSKLVGRVLDYGCGKGDDARSLGCYYYDPHFAPVVPIGPFDTIMCNYVLNVIESDEVRRSVLNKIDALLDHDGCAYIAVRADKKALCGRTSTGSWQGYIELDLPVEYRSSGYDIYKMDKGQSNVRMQATTFDKR